MCPAGRKTGVVEESSRKRMTEVDAGLWKTVAEKTVTFALWDEREHDDGGAIKGIIARGPATLRLAFWKTTLQAHE